MSAGMKVKIQDVGILATFIKYDGKEAVIEISGMEFSIPVDLIEDPFDGIEELG